MISKINARRPFSREVQHNIKMKFLPDRITANLNMEGISVSRRQTLLIMDGMTLSENSLKSEIEVRNAFRADELVFELSNQNNPLTAGAVRDINAQLQEGVLATAGQYRKKDVEITGAAFHPPHFHDVDPLVREMVELFNQGDGNPVFRAAWLHATFTRIHPFEDGNGRTGRLLQDFVLLSAGFYPTGIPAARRDDYYDALQVADQGEWDPLCQMICEFELDVLSRVVAILDQVKSRGQFITTLAKLASNRKSGAQHKQYIVWRQCMKNFANQLQQTCEELNRSSKILRVRTEKFSVVDFNKWQEISKFGRSENTWFLKQTWFSDGNAFYRTIFFFRRHNFRPDDVHSKDDLYGVVALHVTGGKPEGVKYDFEQFTDNDIGLREILYVNEKLHVYSSTNKTRPGKFGEVWNCDEANDYADVIQRFLEDIFRRKLGI